MKLVVVTGWVISGLGKWIVASSIGMLLKNAWKKVSIMKLDPYLQIDAGTMSPYEHWEVFVTYDWWETDLDFWSYERFIDENISKENSLTSWKVFWEVLNKERAWDYLGQTVQLVPHVTNLIKEKIKNAYKNISPSETKKSAENKNEKILIIELGWTIWDIEWVHFVEALRQLRYELGKHNMCCVHLAPVIELQHSWELKTKAIQHSVMKLRELGLQPDILVCRTTASLDKKLKSKIALFCDLEEKNIIEWRDVDDILSIPLIFHDQNLDKIIQKQLFDDYKQPNLKKWEKYIEQKNNSHDIINVALAWKYTNLDDCYLSVLEAFKHAATSLEKKLKVHFLDTEAAEKEKNYIQDFFAKNNIKAVCVPGGFWTRWVEGMVLVAKYARENNIPYLGICLWMQIACIEFGRKIGLDATSWEFESSRKDKVIDIMEEQKNLKTKGWNMRLGNYEAIIKKNSLAQKIYGGGNFRHNNDESKSALKTVDRHRHRYEFNNAFREIFEKNWFVFSGTSPDWKLVEIIENPNCDFFVATQAHPEFLSRPTSPSPIFIEWLKAVK